MFNKNNIYNLADHNLNSEATYQKEGVANMGKDPASCPGISQFMNPTPSYFKCPNCHGDVEIWSDEEEAACPNCGTMVSRGKLQSCLDYCEFADKCRDMIETKKSQRGEL